MARLFVAVWPPAHVVDRIDALVRGSEEPLRFTATDTLHITLRFFGEAAIDDVTRALDDVAFPPAPARLGPTVSVMNGRIVIIPVAGLSALATVVTRSTAGIGDAARDDFVGHITLARLRRDAPVPRIVGTRFGVEFDVDELALVSSRLTPTGAIYETITRWPVVSE